MKHKKLLRKAGAVLLSTALIGCCTLTDSTWNVNTDLEPLTVRAASSGYSFAALSDELFGEEICLSTFTCSDQKGIYFFTSQNDLILYNPETKELSKIKSFKLNNYYTANDKIYFMNSVPDDNDNVKKITVSVYDIKSNKTERTFSLNNIMDFKEAYYPYFDFGVDAQERIYVIGDDGKTIYLFDKNGKLLSQTKSDDSVNRFIGFDSTNGNFYVYGSYNWVYWGYDHDMTTVQMGNVQNNKLSFNNDYIDITSQKYYNDYGNMAELINNQYLCIDSTFNSRLLIYNSNQLNVKDDLNKGVEWIIDGGGGQHFGTSALKKDFYLNRDNSSFYDEEGYYGGYYLSGPRCVYLEKNKTFLACYDESSITEYDINSMKELGTFKTKYPVSSLFRYKDGVAAIELSDTGACCEYIPWIHSTSINVTGSAKAMKIGTTAQLTAKGNGSIEDIITWKSNNSKVASVNASGKVTAWGKGSALITAENSAGIKGTYLVNVVADSVTSVSPYAVTSKGKNGNNASANSYYVWNSVVNSYIQENADGTMSRIESTDSNVLIETYKDNGKTLTATKTVKKELPLFGGFYSGKNHNYLVFGQNNPKGSDSQEVLRVVKYDKSWKRLSSMSVKGANTCYPFDAGCLRMEEVNDLLYIHTCHKMYQSDDGLNHQANMTFVVNEKTMKLKDSYYDVMNISYGYVSHSFNQFIRTDGTSVFRVDHGDAHPRGIALTKVPVGETITDVQYTTPVVFDRGFVGDNDTGASVGGFELSSENCIIVGSSYCFDDQSSDFYVRNIFISVTDKELNESKTKWLTNYKDETTTVNTPQLVKINDEVFLIMWEEVTNSSKFTKLALIDSEGNLKSDIIRSQVRLSDCQPIKFKDGIVRWYTANNSAPVFYHVNPFDLKQVRYVIQPSSVSLNFGQMSLGLGETVKLTATVAPSNAYDKSVKWRTSNPKVLTVDQQGNVKTVGKGTAWITVRTVNGLEKSCKITVKAAPTKVDLSKGVLTLGVGEKYSVSSSINDGAACSKRTYRSSNGNIVKMTRTNWVGDFVAVKPGVAYVTVRTYNGLEKACKVTVKPAPTSVTISKKTLTLKVGQTASLSCWTNEGSGCASRTFSSSNSSIVKMTKTNWTGEFKALRTGTAYVTVKTYNGKTSTCKVTVI